MMNLERPLRRIVLMAIITLAAGAAAAAPAGASVLVQIKNAPVQQQTLMSLDFVAPSSSTVLAFGGYQLPSYLYTTDISMRSLGSTTNLLGLVWWFNAAPTDTSFGSYTDQFVDPYASGANALAFGSVVVGEFDYYSQVVPTTAGGSYTLDFYYTQSYPGANGLKVQINDALRQSPVPEPSIWAMMLSGFGIIGMLCRRSMRSHDPLAIQTSPGLALAGCFRGGRQPTTACAVTRP